MGTIELLVCAECAAKNTIDGAFCRQCGVPLPEEMREKMRAESEKLLIDGRQLLNDGRTDEAGLIADSVLEVDPGNASALALRGDIFERDGLFAEALETYERVMEVRPDNAMDRIRVAHLSKLVAAEEIAVVAPASNRRGILLVAAAGVLLASVGAALYLAGNTTQNGLPDDLLVKNEVATGFNNLDATMVPITPNGVDTSGTSQTQNPITGPVDANNGQGNASYTTSNPSPGYPRTMQGAPTDSGMAPFQPSVKLNPWQNPTGVGGTRPDPGTTQTSTTEQPVPGPVDTDSEPPEEDPGVVEIRVKPGSENSNTAASNGGAMSVEQLIQKARNLYIQENYAGAAEAYEAAIRAGAGTGATYQRLAQCYEKMNRKSDAIRNYRSAVRAFDSQISRGNGSDSVRAAKESCERAISSLGG
jgi:tetratricopeptide (TPR) repeat protein